ncbi:MAG TPA: hypothetical protein ENK11_03295, partial [Phycisphaerales bacterium]|nr:hypothetical protein [Phycisphaerales bacterium]
MATIAYDWDALADELAARPPTRKRAEQGTADVPREPGSPPPADAHALLHDLADPTLSLADLTHIHRATVSALAALVRTEEFRSVQADWLALAAIRETLIEATARAGALAALRDCADNAPNPETRRKAAAAILKQCPRPELERAVRSVVPERSRQLLDRDPDHTLELPRDEVVRPVDRDHPRLTGENPPHVGHVRVGHKPVLRPVDDDDRTPDLPEPRPQRFELAL